MYHRTLSILFLCISSSMLAQVDSLVLTQRQLCDLELLLNGGFAPLEGFMCRDDYQSVINTMRLSDEKVWPVPIVLDVEQETAQELTKQKSVVLKKQDGTNVARLQIQDIYKPNKLHEVQKVYGSNDCAHPGIDYILNKTHDWYVGGSVELIEMPKHYDFQELRKTPKELKTYFNEHNIDKVVAFQTRNPMHRAHVALTMQAGKKIDGHILIHPVVGLTKPGDVDHFTRVRAYKQLLKYYPEGGVTLSLLPIAMRMAGPREALWHALIRKNYGVTHFIVGRDHAGPGNDSNGKPFYGWYDAQKLVKKFADEIGITMVPFAEMVYVQEHDTYMPRTEVPLGATILTISGTELRRRLKSGEHIPSWFTYSEVDQELRKRYPPKNKQGFTLFFTGLSGAGKSTVAEAIACRLMELQDRKVTVLDGDIIRRHLSTELGFSKEHRSLNVRRVGFVAQEISKHGGIAVCALISPYRVDRDFNKTLISDQGGYVEIYVSTPLEICEERDVKGLYQKAREGIIAHFTGISDPYEVPLKPSVVIDTSKDSIGHAVDKVVDFLQEQGYIH